MAGVAYAILAGVGFGFFQATNGRAGRHLDTYVATFGVLVVSVVVLTLIAATTQDLAVLATAPLSAYGWFAAAGGVHFFLGWTFLTLSQRKIGASRTGVVTGTTPLFGTLIAFLVLGERLRAVAFVGVVLVVAGTVALARARTGPPGATTTATAPTLMAGLGLGAALCWGISPVFIRWGLEGMASPLVGVTIGMAAAATAYGVALAVRGTGERAVQRSGFGWVVVAGCVVAVAIAAQWLALSAAPVAVVLALSQLAVPVVIIVAPLLSGGGAERMSPAGLLAAAVVVTGSLVIIFSRA